MGLDLKKLEASFRAESAELIDGMIDSIMLFESEGDMEHLNAVYRVVHTIKGNSGIFDMPRLSSFAHAFESFLERMRESGGSSRRELTDLVLRAADLLRQMLQGDPGTDRADRILRKDLETYGSEAKVHEADIHEASIHEARARPRTIRVSAGLLEQARREGKHLALAHLNLSAQEAVSLNAFYTFLSEERKSGELIEFGPREERLFEGVGKNCFPYFMLLMTDGTPESRLQASGLKPFRVKTIHAPGAKPDVSPSSTRKPPVSKDAPERLGAPRSGSVRVSTALIDELINIAGETVIARNELLRTVESGNTTNLALNTNRINTLVTSLQEKIMLTRLRELDSVFRKLPRLVRESGRATGKQVELKVLGGSVEMDRVIIEALSDSLTHIIRNAVDHGIEEPAQREREGKPPVGLLRIRALLSGGNVVVSIEDDGRGLDYGAITSRALERGILDEKRAQSVTRDELREMIFEPGFSTAASVTTTSGRGVGMDAVRKTIKNAGGTVDVNDGGEAGTVVTLTLPQTMAIIASLLVESGGSRYALPRAGIRELLLMDRKRLTLNDGRMIYNLRGRLLPLISLATLLSEESAEDAEFIVVLKTDRYWFGLIVDRVLDPEEMVIKPLGDFFADLELYSGAAIQGDGDTVLILDAAGIARKARLQADNALPREELSGQAEAGSDGLPYIIFSSGGQLFAVSLEGRPRVEKAAREALSDFLGRPMMQLGETMVNIYYVEELLGAPPASRRNDEFYLIVFAHHQGAAAIVADEIINVHQGLKLSPPPTKSPGFVRGSALVDRKPVLVFEAKSVLSARERGAQEAAS